MHNGGMFLRCTLRVKDGKELLEHRGEPTGFLAACRAEASALPGGNQRQPKNCHVPMHRSVRRASGRMATGGTFSGGSAAPGVSACSCAYSFQETSRMVVAPEGSVATERRTK